MRNSEKLVPEGINPDVRVKSLTVKDENFDRFFFDRSAGALHPDTVEACLTFIAYQQPGVTIACLHNLLFHALDDDMFAFPRGHREALERVLEFLTDISITKCSEKRNDLFL